MVTMDVTTDHSATPDRGVTVRLADGSDLPEVLRVQRAGFERVAARLGFPRSEMPPLTETLVDLQSLVATGVRTFIAETGAEGRQRVVGTVRAVVRDDSVVEIGRLAVDQGYERRGIASALMRSLEDAYPDAARFELYTGAEADDALALYDRLGYAQFRRQDFRSWTRVWLGKDRRAATAAPNSPLHSRS
jgi:ribosomal protein S18 acetylase RimI-like enzyme